MALRDKIRRALSSPNAPAHVERASLRVSNSPPYVISSTPTRLLGTTMSRFHAPTYQIYSPIQLTLPSEIA